MISISVGQSNAPELERSVEVVKKGLSRGHSRNKGRCSQLDILAMICRLNNEADTVINK